MQLAKLSEMKIANTIEPGDYVDFAGVKYAVIENVPCPFSTMKRNITLSSVNTSAGIDGRIFVIVPSTLPMTTFQL